MHVCIKNINIDSSKLFGYYYLYGLSTTCTDITSSFELSSDHTSIIATIKRTKDTSPPVRKTLLDVGPCARNKRRMPNCLQNTF